MITLSAGEILGMGNHSHLITGEGRKMWQKGAVLGPEGPERAPRVGRACAWGSPGFSQSSRPLPVCLLQECRWWLPSPCSDVVLGLSQLLPPQLSTLLSNGVFLPTGELCCRAGGARLGSRLGPGCMLGQLWETGQSPGQSQSASSALFWEQARICALFTSRVQVSHSPSASPAGLQTSQGNSSSSCWTPGLGCPVCGLNCSLPKEDLPAYVILPSFCVISLGHRYWPDCFFSFLPESVWMFLYRTGYRKVFLPVPTLFSVRIAPHVDAVLDRWAQRPPTLPSWSSVHSFELCLWAYVL